MTSTSQARNARPASRRGVVARAAAGAALMAAGATAHALQVDIVVTGVVDYNVIGGGMVGIQSGAPVQMRFSVDSNNFVNSATFPTRGYAIDLASFQMTVGGVAVPIVNPQPSGTAYFVLRDNDPAVDGFFISRGGVDLPAPWVVNVPGLAPTHDLDFLRTFNNATTLVSLDILDAVGSYGVENMSSYQWTLGRFGNPGAEYVYQSITITAVPEPATAWLWAGGLAAGMWRVRRRKAPRAAA